MLTNPVSSLQHVSQLLHDYGKVSYYKVNETKSYILDLGVATSDKTILQNKYPYVWDSQEITYLGIKLTSYPSQLFHANYLPLIRTLQIGLQSLSKHTLSWSGRLAAFKMQILPQILYIFRTVPIPIPRQHFHTLQSILSRHLWDGKKSQKCSNQTP